MSEYLKKQAALEWLKEQQKRQEEKRDRLEIDHPYWEYHEGASDYLSLAVEEFESGAFDADDSEVQRLRAALVEIKQLLNENRENDGAFQSWYHMQAWKVATQALSTTSEPTNKYFGAEWPKAKESEKGLQSVYDQIINILKENNVLINITPPRPYLIKKDDEERINAETESLLKKGKIKEYNSKMEESKTYKLYFDEAYKYTNFYEEGDETRNC